MLLSSALITIYLFIVRHVPGGSTLKPAQWSISIYHPESDFKLLTETFWGRKRGIGRGLDIPFNNKLKFVSKLCFTPVDTPELFT